ncbi:hypothetical protein ES705_49081 [subsurface metagenome]
MDKRDWLKNKFIPLLALFLVIAITVGGTNLLDISSGIVRSSVRLNAFRMSSGSVSFASVPAL